MKKRISVLLVLLMALFCAMPSFAENEASRSINERVQAIREKENKVEKESDSASAEEENAESAEEESEESAEKKEKKSSFRDFSSIRSPHAVVMDRKTGLVLHEKSADSRVYPSDLVKIMTALIVAEKCDMNDIVTVSQNVIDNIDVYQSITVDLQAEDKVSVEQLLYAMILPTADDAALALAEHVAGSEAEFVTLMNKRAQELGLNGTHFTNCTGIDDASQYTTAHDMALLSRAAMDQEALEKIFAASDFEFSKTGNKEDAITCFNNNYLLSAYMTPEYFYDNAVGIKAGYTEQGGYTISAAASNGLGEVIVVVMGGKRPEEEGGEIEAYRDCVDIFDYVFANYSYTTLITANQIVAEYDVPNAKGDGHVLLLCPTTQEAFLPNGFSAEKDVKYNVKLNRELNAPIKKGEILGTAEVLYNNQTMASIELVSDRDLSRSLFKKLGFLKYIFLVIAILFLLVLLMRAYNMRKRKKRKARLNAERRRREERAKFAAASERNASSGASSRMRTSPSLNETELRRQRSLERTTRNIERSAKLTSERAQMRTNLNTDRSAQRSSYEYRSTRDRDHKE